jgi:peptidoglycan hydrolase CwlO-like protein
MNEVMAYINNGLAVIILLAIGIGAWRASVVLFAHVIVPLKDASLAHIKAIEVFMGTTTEALKNTASALQSINNELRGIRTDVDDVKNKMIEVQEKVARESRN